MFKKIPSFERRLTTLQEEMKQFQAGPGDTGLIRLQTTPRQLETLEHQILDQSPAQYDQSLPQYYLHGAQIPSESTSEIQL